MMVHWWEALLAEYKISESGQQSGCSDQADFLVRHDIFATGQLPTRLEMNEKKFLIERDALE